MTVITLSTPARFRLDSARFGAGLIDRGAEPCGFDNRHPGGFAVAVAARFADAWESGAILTPPGVTVSLYPLGFSALILALRENDLPRAVEWPLRQVSTVSFDVDEVACFGDESFEECCSTLRELLRRADRLLPALAAMRSCDQRAA